MLSRISTPWINVLRGWVLVERLSITFEITETIEGRKKPYSINLPRQSPTYSLQLHWDYFGKKKNEENSEARSSVQSLNRVRLFVTPRTAARPGLPVHHQLPEFTQTHVHQVGDVIQPLSSPAPPSFNLSIRVFSNESVLCIRWPKYWPIKTQVNQLSFLNLLPDQKNERRDIVIYSFQFKLHDEGFF